VLRPAAGGGGWFCLNAIAAELVVVLEDSMHPRRKIVVPLGLVLGLAAGCRGHTGGGAAVGTAVGEGTCVASAHYGREGELWKPEGRIVSAAFAGYHTGVDPLPEVAGPVRRVTEFGAKADDADDDTQAFLDGIAAVSDGVLLVPAGRYVVTQRLEIRNRGGKSGFVLRGEGAGKTVLSFPRSLHDLYGRDWSFSGGFITVSGEDAGPQLATITGNAPRGAVRLAVSSSEGIGPGRWVRVVQRDSAGSLFRALHGGRHPGNVRQDGGREVFHHHSRVTAVDGGSITLERPLPLEVDTAWSPEIRAVQPTTREVGIERLTLEMAGTPYPGHFNEEGYNGIYFQGVHDSWVRDVTILNADYGVHFNRSFFCTATGVVLDTTFDRGPLIGHHGLNSSGGADVVFSRFDLRKRYVHDLSVDGYAMTTVWSSGKGIDLNLDHHGRAPYGTLWTNLDVGAARRTFNSGGAGNRMPHTGAYTTLWNVRGAAPVGLPPPGFGPLMTFVAVAGAEPEAAPDHHAVEPIPTGRLCQPDLYEAMVAARRQVAAQARLPPPHASEIGSR
jgi:hypothetical protein